MMVWTGTSYASPAASSLAAIIRQYFEMGYYPNGSPLANNEFYPSAALVKAVMMASGQMMTGSYSDSKFEQKYPNLSQGWGRPMLDDVLYFNGETRKLLVINNSGGLNTGEVVEYEFNVTSDTEHLKFFLAWSDYPGAAGATPAIVNNLDLQVEAPNGTTTFWGNRFPTGTNWLRRGFSIPGGAPDTLNTDEGVIITTGNAQVDNWVTAGVWKVRVMATGVPAGPQPFGLVVSGDLDLNYGIVTLDKKVYSESDTINIEVRDSDAVAVFVDLTSTTESTPETKTLFEVTPGSGIWQGSIDTDFGLPSADGKLQVKEGDTIVATYDDISPIHTSTATATVDASGPKITNVKAEDITNAYAKITWQTDEPSTSKVYWGETSELEKEPIEVTSLMVDHAVELIGLKTDTEYIYDVESADWFGHSTRDDNGGLHYAFKTTSKAEILVIYGDDTFDKEERYRSALEGNGWVYNEWYAGSQGDPPLSMMQEYKVVMWQTGYEQYPPLEDTQRALITDYLDGGGRFFISSHDVQWAFGESSGSGWYNAARAKWLKSTLKAGYQIDPRMFTKIEGVTGEPISGSYTGINAPSYTPTRSGAAGDEIYPESAGGTSFPIWSASGAVDYGGFTDPSSSDFIAIKWWSSAPNGTAGTGVWGGKISKIVAFFFEFTRIEAGSDNSFVRNDILDKVITWLIGADHPDVTVSYPNGGEVLSTGPVTITWSATPYGTSIANQTIYYSDNAGQSWEYLASAGPSATTYDWDISTFPNGNKYMIKVVAEDDGVPSLIGSDESDGTFTIVRPGGDLEGPITVPGSIEVQPHYVVSSQTVWFNATIDDRDRGNSLIAAAEYFIQCAEPELSDYGTGTAMSASDALFDSPIEDVTWTGTITSSSGWYTIWVHGQDIASNWGGFESRTFLLIDPGDPTIDLTPPSAPTNVNIVLEGASFEDIRITWDQSPDDDGNPKNVEYYDIFYSESYSSDRIGYRNLASIVATASPNYNYLDALKGNGDPKDYFYYVSARDQSCNYGANETQLSKFNRALVSGTNLVSIPLILEDESISTVLQTANFDIAWSYDAADMLDPWKSYNPLKPANDLLTVNYSKGLWVTTSMDTDIVAVGKVPDNASAMLQAGWNLVGYPSFILRTIGDALNGIGHQRVEGYDPSPPEYLRLYYDDDNMETGAGYWIKVDTAITWNLAD